MLVLVESFYFLICNNNFFCPRVNDTLYITYIRYY